MPGGLGYLVVPQVTENFEMLGMYAHSFPQRGLELQKQEGKNVGSSVCMVHGPVQMSRWMRLEHEPGRFQMPSYYIWDRWVI